MLADRTWPPPDRLERITGRAEGGWIATGQCGRPHLVGAGWKFWACPTCLRLAAKQRITDRQRRTLDLFYPTGRFPR
jgi:hypothetical protein